MADRFRAADVQIVRGYHVTCTVCGCDVAEYGGHGLPSREVAEDERRAHIAEHRGSEGTAFEDRAAITDAHRKSAEVSRG